MSEGHDVVRLQRTHRERAIDSLTRAFAEDPMWSCVLPVRDARVRMLRPMWAALIAFSRVYGEVFTTTEGQGAACWIAPGKTKTTLWMLLRTGMALPRSMMRLPKEARRRFFGMMAFSDKAHKS